jgi:hypothetical protein
MSKLGSINGGYKGGSERTSTPKITSPKHNPISEILPQIKGYYIDNIIGDDDMLFLINCVRCLGDNVHKPQTKSYNISPHHTERLSNFIENNYKTKRLNLNDLGELINELQNILVNTSQIKKTKSTPLKEESKNDFTSINGGYGGGSPRIKSNNPLVPYSGAIPKQVAPSSIIDRLTTLHSGGNLSDEAIRIIIDNLKQIVS